MARRTTPRTTARAIAALAVLAVTAGPGPLAVSADAEDGVASTALATEKVFQADRYIPRGDRIHSAGTSGYLHVQEGRSGYLWTSYDTGTTTELGSLARLELPAYLGSSSDVVTDVVSPTQKVVLRDLSAGTTTDIALTHGTYRATFGTHVLTQAQDADGNRVLWLYGGGAPADGTLVEGWPSGITANFSVLGGDSGTAVIGYGLGTGERHLALVDLATAKVIGDVAVAVAPTGVALSAGQLVWWSDLKTAHVLDRADLSAAETTVTLPGTEGTPSVGIAGRWLVVARSVPSSPSDWVDKSGERLMAVPLTGGDPITLLRHANSSLVTAPDGSLLAVGGTDAGHWAVRRVTDTGAGTPTMTELTAVPSVAAKIDRLSLQNGTLATDEADSSFLGAYYTRRIADDGTPSAPTWQTWNGRGAGPYATGDGKVVTFTADSDPQGSYVESLDNQWGFFLPSASGTVLDITGRYAVVNGSSPAKQYVGDLGVYSDLQPILTRSVTAASVWGTKLWTPGSGNGVVTARDLKTGTTTDTVSTGAPCVPKELQTVGRWIYWSCGPTATAGVYDRTSKKSITVPSGEALLGDGYVVRHDTSAGALLLTAFADGTATTRKIGDLAAGTSSLRGVTWTVDKFGGPVAYVDADRRIHLVGSGVATQQLSAVETEATDNTSESSAASSPWWQWRGLLSKPAASWTATLTSKTTGAVVRTLSGGEVAGNLTARWDTRDSKGALVPNGSYTFKLTALPTDGSGAALTVSRTVQVSVGAAVRHDFTNGGTWAPDGTGDALTLSSSGVISYRPGNGTGAFGKAMPASGWPSSVTLVPFGDLNGDRRNDVLVRFSSGELRVYRTMRGQAFLTSTPHASLGKGWNQYDILTSPGDVSGDGRPDLMARNSSTGAVYLYKGTSSGKLSSRVKLYDNWKTYKKIVGVGDLNGDGIGDLLAQDKSNNLYRYTGTGKGTFKARAKLFSAWGGSYNAIVGVGDITGDGKADIISRDTSGNLWRNNGNGKGSFGPRVKIATGWQAYKGVF
ncbi:FG-GAP-like repeat-containing protein [Streptomyces cylindrosporus]|uniref:FG-GAP-like repeat-containing protein n=1 Tax=Streptomyces cylindrosporus TaxID=2927583 RepID=A0ABS9YCJ3_9ACTN|nr:FG-GAP-like repeat-containing protein [Streptomyces cylindrosporus]MCI3274940.1 FG-GAP-like repeat-containing protein [Streptomyces cylindrosporus]